MAHRPPIINVMVGAALKAARGLIRDFGEVEQLQVSKKGPADFVSEADRRAERLLKAELGKARPDYAFLMEETGASPGAPGAPRWLVDPLDGTSNFLHGLPHFAISIAVEEANGDVSAGVIYDPVKDEMFWAVRGEGAYLNDRRLRVSGREKLLECLLATGIPFAGREGFDSFSHILAHVMPKVAGIRRFGAAALDLAYVAAGRYDGFWEQGLSPWDIAAGLLLVREAGGIVTDIKGGDKMLATGGLIAANPHIHSRIHKLIYQGMKAAKA
ncbi:MAG: inositol monophosphatase family protein [Pseudomonadota bacterium]